jgi:hypothetical protein
MMHKLCGLPFSTKVTRSLRRARRSTYTDDESGFEAHWCVEKIQLNQHQFISTNHETAKLSAAKQMPAVRRVQHEQEMVRQMFENGTGIGNGHIYVTDFMKDLMELIHFLAKNVQWRSAR